MRNPPQKFIACLFVIILAAAGFFVVGRIARKPIYEAHEKRQCDLLAASTLAFFVRKTELSPDLWDAFAEDKIVLILDHRAVPGNWNIRLIAVRSLTDGAIALKAEAASGWNSRSPRSAVRRALLPGVRNNGKRPQIFFDETADFTPLLPPGPEDKTLTLGR